STKDEALEDADDPVPAHVAELLRELDLGAVYETLRDGLPVRKSANTRVRLRRLRKALDDAFADVWLDRSQRAALALDRAWGELTHDDLCIDGRTFSSPDEWWAALRAGSEGTPAAQR